MDLQNFESSFLSQDEASKTAENPKTEHPRATGPKTARGKRISSRNAIKHGAFSQELIREHLLDPEDRKKYRDILQDFTNTYQPVGQIELFQIELMATYMHKFKCVLRLSRALRGDATRNVVNDLFNAGSDSEQDEQWRLDIPSLETLEKLNRAENHCLHQYYRAAAELERLQGRRLGYRTAPRLTVDVNA